MKIFESVKKKFNHLSGAEMCIMRDEAEMELEEVRGKYKSGQATKDEYLKAKIAYYTLDEKYEKRRKRRSVLEGMAELAGYTGIAIGGTALAAGLVERIMKK